MLKLSLLATAAACLLLGAACQSSTPAPPAQPQQQVQYYPQQQGYPPQQQPGYPPQQPYPQQQPGYPPQPQPYPQQQPGPQPQQGRALLAPLVGPLMQQQEVRSILAELINVLSAQNQQLVRGIPMSFDPTIEVNAYAGCDEQGTPFLAATAGILEAVDAISQTKATDELFGTQTYEAYCAQVLPKVVSSAAGRAALPAGIIPANYYADPRRWSRAHEIFDDVIAFTFGHELAHHYLGHTGCAHGQPFGPGPDPTKLGRIASVIPFVNQFNEAGSDSGGMINVLDAGRRRRPQYEWSEYGAVALLDFFARLERAAGGGGLGSVFNPLAVLKTHPNPLVRIPVVQGFARNWRAQHPG